jgi:hypothetical protein
MRHETVTIAAPSAIDWKGLGYLFSIAGALLLGALAWPKPEDPAWHLPALIAGVATTIVGFFIRYLAHLREKREIREANAKADRSS